MWTLPRNFQAIIGLIAIISAALGPASVYALDPLVKEGLRIFTQETFGGNGRTCATCHRLERSTTIDPEFITTLPADDPLFVSETNPELADLEDSTLLRQFGLFKTSPDPNIPNFRSANHTLALRTTMGSLEGPRLGWRGRGGSDLREFTNDAIRQHAPLTLARVEGVDFRLATDDEMDALEAFQLFLGRQTDLSLPLSLVDDRASQGQTLFLDDTVAKCTRCHFNAGAVATGEDGAVLGETGANNPSFDTGVEILSQQIAAETGVFIPTDVALNDGGRFNVPPLVEAADTTPLFHNHAARTLRDGIAFYTGAEFNNSPHGVRIVGGIILNDQQIDLLAAFLTVINADENVREAIIYLQEAIIEQSDPDIAQLLVTIAVAQLEDAIRVLGIEDLHSDVRQLLQSVIGRLDSLLSFNDLAPEVLILSSARDLMITAGPGGDPGDPLSLSSVSPSVLVAGSTVDITVTGTGIQDGATAVVCRTGGTTTNSVTVLDATTLVANVTVDTGTSGECEVVVTNPDGASDSLPPGTITITAEDPGGGGNPLSLTNVSPSTLVAGSTVDITVTGTGIQDGATAVVCRTGGTTTNSVTVLDATTLVANVTINLGAQGRCGVVVTNPDGASDSLPPGTITITAEDPGGGGDPLSLTSVSPSVLVAGSTVDVTVTVTGTGIQDGATVVICRIGGTITNSVTVPDATTLVANVTVAQDAPRSCGVVVTNPDGASEILRRGSITIQ